MRIYNQKTPNHQVNHKSLQNIFQATPEFIKFFATHYEAFDLLELAKDISKLQTIKPLATLKEAFINIPAECQPAYLECLVNLGDINRNTLDESRQEQILQQLEFLQEGISLRLAQDDPELFIYNKNKESALKILLVVENRVALINRSYKKIRSALFKALWTGLIRMEIPIVWEPQHSYW